MRKAVIDIGTNSTRLAVADCIGQQIQILAVAIEMTRIGEGASEDQQIKAMPLARTVAAVQDFVRQARELEAERLRITATSAVREAINQAEVAEAIVAATGVALEILSGSREAQLSYQGAALDFAGRSQTLAVLDIGGGSTELVYQGQGGLSKASVRLGAVRLAEQPSLSAEIESILTGLITEQLPAELTLIGVGGTITSLAAMDQKLDQYNQQRVHGYRLSRGQVEAWLERLYNLSVSQRSKLKGLMPQRADIIPYGVEILLQAMKLLDVEEIIVSDKDLLYGLLAE